MINRKLAEWLVIFFFLGVVAVVFQQIMTDMTKNGIASGGPYNNAAAYPRAIAIIIGALLVILLALRFIKSSLDKIKTGSSDAVSIIGEIISKGDEDVVESEISKPPILRAVLLLVVFTLYLLALGLMGYHLSTPLMLMAIMLLGGMRKPLQIVLPAIAISLVFSFVFEVLLKIVLPVGRLINFSISWI